MRTAWKVVEEIESKTSKWKERGAVERIEQNASRRE